MPGAMRRDPDRLVEMVGAGVFRAGRWLVRDVDLTVARGEIVTLIGPNGSGKSTTAKAAVGAAQVDEGVVKRAPGLTVGYVPQKVSIDWTLPLSVARLMTLTKRADANEVRSALQDVGIAHLADAEVQTLSGGEFQRALLARALLRKPDLLVLDEPVQGVDFAGEIALYDLIGRIRDRTGCGVLLISHDLHVVMGQTDTVICLNGHVCCRGTPEAVAGSAEYRHLFGARAAASLAVYRHHHDHAHLPDGRVRHADGSLTDHCHHDDGHHGDELTEPPTPNPSPQGGGGPDDSAASPRSSAVLAKTGATPSPSPLWGGNKGGGEMQGENDVGSRPASAGDDHAR